jgi:ribose-phosphate pyrophosphokinase
MPAIKLYGLGDSRAQAERIGALLGLPLSEHEEREFEDGEHKSRPLDDVRGAAVHVVHSLHGDPAQSANDKLCRLLFFLAAARDHGAASITAVVPYLCYSRKDRRTKPHDPIVTRYVAQLFEAIGTDALLTLDVHNQSAFENAFRCRAWSLDTHALFATRLAALLHGREVSVIAPDAGAVKRADSLRMALAERMQQPIGFGLMEKRRSAGVVSGDALFADVAGRSVVLVDDLVNTGTTLLRAAQASRAAGAASVIAVVTHGLFVDPAGEVLADPAIDRILVSDSVPPFRLQGRPAAGRVELIECAPLFADAIRRIGAAGRPD